MAMVCGARATAYGKASIAGGESHAQLGKRETVGIVFWKDLYGDRRFAGAHLR